MGVRWYCGRNENDCVFRFFRYVHFSKIENKSPCTGIKQLIKVTGDSFVVNKMNVYFWLNCLSFAIVSLYLSSSHDTGVNNHDKKAHFLVHFLSPTVIFSCRMVYVKSTNAPRAVTTTPPFGPFKQSVKRKLSSSCWRATTYTPPYCCYGIRATPERWWHTFRPLTACVLPLPPLPAVTRWYLQIHTHTPHGQIPYSYSQRQWPHLCCMSGAALLRCHPWRDTYHWTESFYVCA